LKERIEEIVDIKSTTERALSNAEKAFQSELLQHKERLSVESRLVTELQAKARQATEAEYRKANTQPSLEFPPDVIGKIYTILEQHNEYIGQCKTMVVELSRQVAEMEGEVRNLQDPRF